MTFQSQFLDFVTEETGHPELLNEIKPVGQLTPQGVLNVYRTDYTARMFEALSKNFEATWLLLGDEEFMKLATSYISNTPSTYSNLTKYGETFPDFLVQKFGKSDLVTMAFFEKTFWEFFHQKDSFEQLITSEDLEQEFNQLDQRLSLFKAEFDLVNIWQHRETPQLASYEERNQCLAVYKKQNKVEVQEIFPETFQLLQLLKEEKKLTRIILSAEKLPNPPQANHWAQVFEILAYCR